MATVSERLALIINFNGDAAIKGLDGVAKKSQGAHEETRKLSDNLTKMGSIGLAASGVAAVGLSKLAMGASDLNEVTSKSKVLFGEASKSVESFADKAAKNLGQSKVAALEAATTFAGLGRATGMGGQALADFSTKLVTLSGDLASFANTSPEEAVHAIGAALRGENEEIRKYNVMLDDATLKQRAMSMGLIETTTATLPPAIKMQAAYAEIMAQTTAAQGDFARTSDGAANQQRILKAEIKNLADGIGVGLLPAFTGAVKGASSLVGKLNEMSPATKSALGGLAAGGVGVTAAVSGVALVAGQVAKLKDRFADGEGGLNNFGKAGVVAGVAVAGLSVVLAAMARKSAEAKGRVDDLAKATKDLGITADVAAARKILAMVNASQDYTDVMKKAGISTEEVRSAVIAGGVAYDEVKRKLAAFAQAEQLRGQASGEATGKSIGLTRSLVSEIDKERVAVDSLNQAKATDLKTSQDIVPVTDTHTKSISEHRRAVQDDIDAVDDQTKRTAENNQKLKDAEQLLKDLTAAQDRSTKSRQEAIDQVRASTDKEFGYAQAQRDTRDAAREAEQKIKDATKAKGKDQEKNDEAAASQDAFKLRVLEEAKAFAESKGAVDGSRDSVDKQIVKLSELRDQYAKKFPEIAAFIDDYILQLKNAAAASSVSLTVPGFERSVSAGGGGQQRRASGGPVTAGATYWVGENGPEPFTPDTHGTITPSDRAGRGGGMQLVANFYGITDTRAMAGELGREMAWRLKVGA